MRQRSSLIQQALVKALRVRQSEQIAPWDALCVYDLAERLGLEVRFVDVNSLEGMYCRATKPYILVSANRPDGRQAYTCAHELGHHVFNHSTRFDEIVADLVSQPQTDPEEFLVDCFAGFLLMPKSAVEHAFAVRGWVPQTSTPTEVYTVARWLGVGYSTLIHQMRSVLSLVSASDAARLLKYTPQKIRREALGDISDSNLLIVDEHWTGRAIDTNVGDLILLPTGVSVDGSCVSPIGSHPGGTLFRGSKPGRGQVRVPKSGWAAYIRVSRAKYIGRNMYRHLEDPDED